MKERQVDVDGQTRNAREEAFEIKEENWNTYVLESGTEIRVKMSVLKIMRLLDAKGRPEFTGEGDPEVLVRHQVHVVTSGGPERISEGEVN